MVSPELLFYSKFLRGIAPANDFCDVSDISTTLFSTYVTFSNACDDGFWINSIHYVIFSIYRHNLPDIMKLLTHICVKPTIRRLPTSTRHRVCSKIRNPRVKKLIGIRKPVTGGQKILRDSQPIIERRRRNSAPTFPMMSFPSRLNFLNAEIFFNFCLRSKRCSVGLGIGNNLSTWSEEIAF